MITALSRTFTQLLKEKDCIESTEPDGNDVTVDQQPDAEVTKAQEPAPKNDTVLTHEGGGMDLLPSAEVDADQSSVEQTSHARLDEPDCTNTVSDNGVGSSVSIMQRQSPLPYIKSNDDAPSKIPVPPLTGSQLVDRDVSVEEKCLAQQHLVGTYEVQENGMTVSQNGDSNLVCHEKAEGSNSKLPSDSGIGPEKKKCGTKVKKKGAIEYKTRSKTK